MKSTIEYKPGTFKYLVAIVDSFDDVSDLKRENLTVADYRALVEVKKDMVDLGGGVDFDNAALKNFFDRHGFIVVPNDDVGGWYVSFIKQG